MVRREVQHRAPEVRARIIRIADRPRRRIATKASWTRSSGATSGGATTAANRLKDGGPLLTAWTLDDDYDLNQFDIPVTIGAIPGRAKSRADGTSTALNRMTVAWPLGPGRTAFVDASGFPNEQVIEMAASLTFESAIPVMAVRPAGFHQIDAPVPGRTTETVLNLLTDSPTFAAATTDANTALVFEGMSSSTGWT